MRECHQAEKVEFLSNGQFGGRSGLGGGGGDQLARNPGPAFLKAKQAAGGLLAMSVIMVTRFDPLLRPQSCPERALPPEQRNPERTKVYE